jgi:hypothetical protein
LVPPLRREGRGELGISMVITLAVVNLAVITLPNFRDDVADPSGGAVLNDTRAGRRKLAPRTILVRRS